MTRLHILYWNNPIYATFSRSQIVNAPLWTYLLMPASYILSDSEQLLTFCLAMSWIFELTTYKKPSKYVWCDTGGTPYQWNTLSSSMIAEHDDSIYCHQIWHKPIDQILYRIDHIYFLLFADSLHDTCHISFPFTQNYIKFTLVAMVLGHFTSLFTDILLIWYVTCILFCMQYEYPIPLCSLLDHCGHKSIIIQLEIIHLNQKRSITKNILKYAIPEIQFTNL